MAETEKKDLEASVEKVIKKGGKGIGSLVQKAIATLIVAGITWLGTYISKQYDKVKTDHESISKRLDILEQDQAKWATLADLQEQQIQMKIQLEILRQVFTYEYNRKVPTGFPERPGEPDLKPPAELFRDVERYKSMQEQRVAPKK